MRIDKVCACKSALAGASYQANLCQFNKKYPNK